MDNQASDQENEKKRREARVLLGSVPEPKTVRLNTNCSQPRLDDLSEHRESSSDDSKSAKRSELPHLLAHLGWGLVLAAGGAILLFLVWPAYSRSTAVIPGATKLFFVGGIILLVIGPIYVLTRLVDFFVGPKLSTPTECVKTFIGSLGGRNWSRVWNCLTPRAREFFKTPKDCENYLNHTRKKIEEETFNILGANRKVDKSLGDSLAVGLSHTLQYDNLHVSNLSEHACIAEFDLVVKQKRAIHKKKAVTGGYQYWQQFEDGQLILPQSKGLVRRGGDWLLTSGMIDTPWEEISRKSEKINP